METTAHADVQSFLTQESKLQNEINCKTHVLIDHLKYPHAPTVPAY